MAMHQPSVASGVAQPEKKKSLFAQQRDRMLQKQREEAAAAGTGAAAAVAGIAAVAPPREVVQMSMQPVPAATSSSMHASSAVSTSSASATAGASRPVFAASVLPEAKGVSEENDLRLAQMSVDEIEEQQREIEAMLPPELVAMLRARRTGAAAVATTAKSVGAAAAAAAAPLIEREYPLPQQLDEDLLGEVDGADADQDFDSSDEEAAMDEEGNLVSRLAERHQQDSKLSAYSAQLAHAAQAHKLEWSAPIVPTGEIQWPTTVDGYQNDGDVWNSFRVDLEGCFCGQTKLREVLSAGGVDARGSTEAAVAEDEDDNNALYHHGDQADRPGYTMREILHLVRSTVMSQRTLALQVLAKVLARIRHDQYEYPAPAQPTPRAQVKAVDMNEAPGDVPAFAHLLFSHLLYLNVCTLLRLSLDDNRNTAGVLAALHALAALVYHPAVNYARVVALQDGWRGHLAGRSWEHEESLVGEMTPKAPTPEERRKMADADQHDETAVGADGGPVSDNAKDEELCGKDLLVGLVRMQVLERLRFICERWIVPAVQYRTNPLDAKKSFGTMAVAMPTVQSAADATAALVLLSPTVHILLAVSQHSPQAAMRVFSTPRMKEMVVLLVKGLASIIAQGRTDATLGLPTSNLVSSLELLILLVSTLAQLDRRVAWFFVQSGVPASLKQFVVLVNGLPGMKRDPFGDAELACALPLSIQALHFWRVCLAYGLDADAFMDHHHVLQGLLVDGPNRIGATGAMQVLWLRQLRAALNVVEGLTLLFRPRSTPPAALGGGLKPSATQALSESAAPPPQLSFEFAHVIHAVDAVLSGLPTLFFAPLAEDASSEVRIAFRAALAASLHLLGSYYHLLPSQSAYEVGRTRVQVDKHTRAFFQRTNDSQVLADAWRLVAQATEQGVEKATAADNPNSPSPLPFSNLACCLPPCGLRSLSSALLVWFGLVRWQAAVFAQRGAHSSELHLLAQDAVATTRDARKVLLAHFFAPIGIAGGSGGGNRVHSRAHPLSPMESELIVSLLALSRAEANASTSLSVAGHYQCVVQLIPSLLRNGQQHLVAQLFESTVFHATAIQALVSSSASATNKTIGPMAIFPPAACQLLRAVYAHFAYLSPGEESGVKLQASRMQLEGDLLVPTLVVPIAAWNNPLANRDVTTGGQFCVTAPLVCALSAATPFVTSATWLLGVMKHGRFLQVQQSKGGANVKLTLVTSLLRFLAVLDTVLGVFTPSPTRGAAHPAAVVYLRALMELFLLGSEVFCDADVSKLLTGALDKLLAWTGEACSARFVGVAGHATSTLMFGASITAPGSATIRTQGTEMVKLIPPEEQGRHSPTATAASTDGSHSSGLVLSSLRPFYDFNTVLPSSLWGLSFYPFFKDFVEHFVSDSFGDRSYARCLVLLLRLEYPTDYRLVIWRECSELMPALDVDLPVDDVGFLFPYEMNGEILSLLMAHVAGGPALLDATRNQRLFRVAIHHLAIHLFGWPHVSSQAVMPAAERAKRVHQMVPSGAHPDCLAALQTYRYTPTKGVVAAAEAKIELPNSSGGSDGSGIDSSAAVVSSSSASPPAASATASTSASPAPTAASLTPARLREIASVRAAARARGLLVPTPDGVWAHICPCCTKPNATTVQECTGCAMTLDPADIKRMPDNVFMAIVERDPDALATNTIRFRGMLEARATPEPAGDGSSGSSTLFEAIVFDDKYGSSVHHLDCIPATCFVDISHLRREHAGMLEALYQAGRQEFMRRAIPWLPAGESIDDLITAGYNHPVSVKHLHLHMTLPPYFHERVFTPGRWHSHEKVVRDLRVHGRVRLYADHPGAQTDEECAAVYERAISASRRLAPLKEAWERQQAQLETSNP